MADSHDTQTLPAPQSAIERRRFLTLAGGLAAATAAAGAVAVQAARAGEHPDAELLRLGAEFIELYDVWGKHLIEAGRLADAEMLLGRTTLPNGRQPIPPTLQLRLA